MRSLCSPGSSVVKSPPTMQTNDAGSILGSGSDLLEEGMETHSSIFARKFHGQKGPMVYSPWCLQRVGQDSSPSHTHVTKCPVDSRCLKQCWWSGETCMLLVKATTILTILYHWLRCTHFIPKLTAALILRSYLNFTQNWNESQKVLEYAKSFIIIRKPIVSSWN